MPKKKIAVYEPHKSNLGPHSLTHTNLIPLSTFENLLESNIPYKAPWTRSKVVMKTATFPLLFVSLLLLLLSSAGYGPAPLSKPTAYKPETASYLGPLRLSSPDKPSRTRIREYFPSLPFPNAKPLKPGVKATTDQVLRAVANELYATSAPIDVKEVRDEGMVEEVKDEVGARGAKRQRRMNNSFATRFARQSRCRCRFKRRCRLHGPSYRVSSLRSIAPRSSASPTSSICAPGKFMMCGDAHRQYFRTQRRCYLLHCRF